MDRPPSNDDAFARVLGDELRQARKTCGWTRKQLQAQLPSEVSIQTLATYELGTRQCSVARLVELCHTMDVFAHDLLERVHERTAHRDRTGRLLVDLDRLVLDRQPELLPLRRWACRRLDHVGLDQSHAVPLDMAALDRMAELCGVTRIDLINRLGDLNDGEAAGAAIPVMQTA